MAIEKKEIDLRFSEQFEVYKLNIVISAAIATFALGDKGDQDGLLIIPWVSFCMFMYWVYQGISIRSADRKASTEGEFWEWIRRIFAFVGRMTNFFIFPLIALGIHTGNNYPIFKKLTYILPFISIGIYLLWFYHQYYYTYESSIDK